MKVPEQLVEAVKHFEGFHRVVQRRPTILAAPYSCPAGYWTIGYGVLCRPDRAPITIDEGMDELRQLLPVYVAHAVRLSPVLAHESDSRLTAIADFIFNLGPTRYASSTLRRRVNAREWSRAAEEIQRWVYGGGRKLPGLVARRRFEAELLL